MTDFDPLLGGRPLALRRHLRRHLRCAPPLDDGPRWRLERRHGVGTRRHPAQRARIATAGIGVSAMFGIVASMGIASCGRRESADSAAHAATERPDADNSSDHAPTTTTPTATASTPAPSDETAPAITTAAPVVLTARPEVRVVTPPSRTDAARRRLPPLLQRRRPVAVAEHLGRVMASELQLVAVTDGDDAGSGFWEGPWSCSTASRHPGAGSSPTAT